VMIKYFIGTKSLKKILERLKWKVSIFIGTKNIFNPIINIRVNIVREVSLLFGLLLWVVREVSYLD